MSKKKMITIMPELREKYNLTQEELAIRVNVCRETIVRMEQGLYIPSLKLAIDIADQFNTSVYNVFFFVNEK